MVYHIWYCGSHPRRPRGSYFVPPQLTASWVSEDVWFIAILQKCGIPEGAGVEGLMASFELKFPLLSLDLHDNIYLVFFFLKIRITNSFTLSPYRPLVSCLNHLYTASYTVSSRLTRRFSLLITSIRCSADIARKSGSLSKLLKFQSTKRSILALKFLCFNLCARL